MASKGLGGVLSASEKILHATKSKAINAVGLVLEPGIKPDCAAMPISPQITFSERTKVGFKINAVIFFMGR